MMNLGIRAHDISADSLENLVKGVSKKNLTAVQLALPKSLNYMNIKPGSLSTGLANHVGKAFREKNIDIAVLGCYIHMIHPNEDVRRKELERFKEYLRYARDFGCSIVGTETGWIHAEPRYTTANYTEEAFEKVIVSVRKLVQEAEKFGVIVGVEGGINHPIYSPAVMKKLLDRINSNNIQVIFDPVNFITLENYANQEAMFQEALALFGDRITIVHAKDFVIKDNKIIEVPVGKGLLDYKNLLKLLKAKKPYLHYLMESTTDPYIDESADFLRTVYNNV